MKLLYLNGNSLDTSMAHMHQTVAMCNAFAENGIDVILSVPKTIDSEHSLLAFHRKYERINFKVVFREVSLIEKINRYVDIGFKGRHIKSIQPDLIFTRDPSSLHLAINSKIKTVFELHNSLIHHSSKLLNLYWSSYVRKVSGHKRVKLVAISAALKNFWIEKGVHPEKIISQHDGFDEKQVKQLITKTEARKALNMKSAKIYVTYAGSLGADRKVASLIELAHKLPEIEVLVIGGSDKQVEMMSRIKKEQGVSNITFTGQIPHKDVPQYLTASDILIAIWSKSVPTIYYCSPLKIFEYMISGNAIVADDFPTIREVLKNNENSILITPESLDELVKAVELLIREPKLRINLGNNARLEAFNNYSWNKRAAKIIDYVNS